MPSVRSIRATRPAGMAPARATLWTEFQRRQTGDGMVRLRCCMPHHRGTRGLASRPAHPGNGMSPAMFRRWERQRGYGGPRSWSSLSPGSPSRDVDDLGFATDERRTRRLARSGNPNPCSPSRVRNRVRTAAEPTPRVGGEPSGPFGAPSRSGISPGSCPRVQSNCRSTGAPVASR